MELDYHILWAHSVEEALELDKENNNNLWYQAILKEMKNVKAAFREYENVLILKSFETTQKYWLAFKKSNVI